MHPVQFVSLGPGEPELITVKGLKVLQTADRIFCPETLTKDGRRISRAVDILLQLDIPENTIYRFSLPMNKQREKALEAYNQVYIDASTLQQKGEKRMYRCRRRCRILLFHTLYIREVANRLYSRRTYCRYSCLHCRRCKSRIAHCQSGRTAHGYSRHYYGRRNRKTDKRKKSDCHHETIPMYR